MRDITITIRVDFPALSDLVSFLNGDAQKKIDVAATQLSLLTARLATSREALQGAIETNHP